MVSQIFDVTTDFNRDAAVVLDINSYNYVTVHVVTATSTVSFSASNDGGAIQGATNDEPATAANFVAFLGTNLTAGTTATSLASGSAIFSFPAGVKYLKVSGTANSVTKLLISCAKIS